MKKLLLLLLLVIAGLNTPRDATACGGPDYGAFGALAPLDSALFDLTMPEAEWANWGNAHIPELRFLYPFRKKADLAWQFAHENLEHAPPLALTALDDAMRRDDLAAIDREARRVIDQLLDMPAPLAAEQSTLFWRAVELVELGLALARVSAAERRDYLRGAVGVPMPPVLQKALDARHGRQGRWREAAKLMDRVDRDRAGLYRHVGELTRKKEWLELARFYQQGRMFFEDEPWFYRGCPRWALGNIATGLALTGAQEHTCPVTLRVRDHVRNLRSQLCYRVIDKAFRAWSERDGFRLLHFSVMGNHLHLVAEAKNRRALSRAMQGIAIRIAKGLNAVMGQRGSVFAHRYYNRVLHTAREVRNVLAYVLNNARRHRLKKNLKKSWIDEYSSAHAFDGWLSEVQSRAQAPPPVVPGKSLLMQTWRLAGGRIAPDFVPGSKDGFQEHRAAI